MKLKQMSNYALKIYLQSQPNPKQLISFDLGTKHIGSAISCFNLKKPYLLKSFKIKSSSPNDDYTQFYNKLQKEMLRIYQQNKPKAFIIGIPQRFQQRHYYQTNNIAMRTLIEGFTHKYQKQQLKDNTHQIKYTFVDQSWTSRQATQKLKDLQNNYAKWGHLHKEKHLIDGMAAMKILQRYLIYYQSK